MPDTKKIIEIANVKNNQNIAKDTYLLELNCPNISASAKAGQFVNISILSKTPSANLLKRPFGIHNVAGETLSIMFKVKGEVTDAMSILIPGDKVEILGPLGNSFSQCKNKNLLIIGGGMGIAPLYYLYNKLKDSNDIIMIHGVKTLDEVIPWQEAEIKTHIDDVEGYFVCENIDKYIQKKKIEHIQACGPMPMMKAIVLAANKAGITAEVSLEARMACGFGACIGCVIETKTGYKKVCADGPVFDGAEIW